MVQDQLVTIHLGGALGKRFGAKWPLYLSNPSPSEAIRAIDANTKGEFTRYLRGPGAKRYYKVALGRKDNLLDKEEYTRSTGKGDIYILPTVKGSKSGWAKIVVGLILIAVTYGAATPAVAGYLGTTVAVLQGVGYGLAASMILGGITQLLTPTPSFGQNSEGDSRGSNLLGGNAIAVSQGGAVGLVYGRALVSPMPISLSISAIDQQIANSFAEQEYDIVYGPDGVIEYVPRAIDESDGLP